MGAKREQSEVPKTATAAKGRVINWLMQGDVSIQFQTQRDLFDSMRPDLQARIEK